MHVEGPRASLNHICYTANGVVFCGRSLTNFNGASLLLIDKRDGLAHAANVSFKQRKAEGMNLELEYYNDFSQRTDSPRLRRWQQGNFLARKCAEIATAR